MQLSLRDVSQVLSVAESTITRWIKQRGLPAQYVAGQYRFNRAELLEWATAQQVKFSAELLDHLESKAESVPTLVQAITEGGIIPRLPGTNKEEVLRSLVQVLPLPEGIDRDFLLRLFLAREASASTAIGNGIALPHVRNPIVLHVERPMITLCYLEKPIDFGALDHKPVQVLFSLISPTMRAHLQLLARLSFVLQNDVLREVIQQQRGSEKILSEIAKYESTLA